MVVCRLREYIQVNKWEPRRQEIDRVEYRSWVFKKSAFEDSDGMLDEAYTKHLDEAAEQAVQMKRAFQRFQLVAELHLFEVVVAKWLLRISVMPSITQSCLKFRYQTS